MAAESPDGGGFLLRVADQWPGERQLHFEDRVDAFRRNVETGFVWEQERGVEIVEDNDVDLAGAAAFGIDDEAGGGRVALREIAAENVEPDLLGGGAGGNGVFDVSADGHLGEHLLLDGTEGFDEVEVAQARQRERHPNVSV